MRQEKKWRASLLSSPLTSSLSRSSMLIQNVCTAFFEKYRRKKKMKQFFLRPRLKNCFLFHFTKTCIVIFNESGAFSTSSNSLFWTTSQRYLIVDILLLCGLLGLISWKKKKKHHYLCRNSHVEFSELLLKGQVHYKQNLVVQRSACFKQEAQHL